MFKEMCLFVFLATLPLPFIVNAEVLNGPTTLKMSIKEDLTINGPAELTLVRAQTLVVKGSMDFSRLDIAQSAEIYGPVKGEKGKFGSLKIIGSLTGTYISCKELNVKGPVKVSYLEVKNDTEVFGPFDAQQSRLNDLRISSDTSTLDTVSVRNIVIKNDMAKEEQSLYLKGETVIEGDITFESGKGVVLIESSHVQIKGKVIGAKTEKKT